MKNFVGVPSVLSVLVLVVSGCSNSSSTTPSDDAGGSVDSSAKDGSPTTGGDGGSCPAAPASGAVPTYTAPALSQGVCAASDVSAFVMACGSAGSATTCATYGATASACTSCLFSSGSTIAPIETLSIGGQPFPNKSVGACILVAGGTGAAGCAGGVDSLADCLILACAACPASEETSCAMQGGSAMSSVCESYSSGTSACAAHATAAIGCETITDTILATTATGICGSPATSDAGAGDAGEADAGASDAAGD
jgi:hypothetical protein